QSRNPDYREGDVVRALVGWEEYSRVPADTLGLAHVDTAPGLPLSYFMGSLGPSGLTAYVGLHRIGTVAAGETVVVSAASGAVGNVVGQIAKIRGCRAIGIVGNDDKARLCRQLGYDATVNYRATPDLAKALADALGDGADIYFDNVGGATLDAMLPLMKTYGRIVVCGMIANYNDADNPYPIRNLWQILVKRTTMRGFLTYDHTDLIEQAQRDLNAWALSGQLQPLENVTHGIENTPAAFIRLMSGQTSGKTVVRLHDT
ncbi:MAG: NADP-dependent oxidoreductase, partial [Alphaproteobacteria bacterium]